MNSESIIQRISKDINILFIFCSCYNSDFFTINDIPDNIYSIQYQACKITSVDDCENTKYKNLQVIFPEDIREYNRRLKNQDAQIIYSENNKNNTILIPFNFNQSEEEESEEEESEGKGGGKQKN